MTEHPAHSGHDYGGAFARGAALAAGDPDWMNATGGEIYRCPQCGTEANGSAVHALTHHTFPPLAVEEAIAAEVADQQVRWWEE